MSRNGNRIQRLDWVEHLGKRVLDEEKYEGKGVLSIILINDQKIQEINRRFLGRDQPTDVISFPLGETDFKESVWGEIYVSEERAKEQAEEYRVTFQIELARLVVHGILHLVGYDDLDSLSKKRMEKRENHFLNDLEKWIGT